MTEWVLVDNPVYAGQEPRVLTASCHDRTPFITIRCKCEYEFHVHESQVKGRDDAEILARCYACREILAFPPGYFAAAFQTLRDAGWLE